MTMLRLSRADAVIAQGTLCAVERIDLHVVQLRPLGGEDAPISLSHSELMDLLTSGCFEVEYGYFGSRQAARRAMAGRGLLSLLSTAEQQLVFWKIDWCEAFLAAEASGEVSRSDRSCSAFIPELERRVSEKMRQAANGNVLPYAVFRPTPCRTSLMGWVRIWEKTRDPMALVKKSRFNGVNARKIGRDQEAILQRKLADFPGTRRRNHRIYLGSDLGNGLGGRVGVQMHALAVVPRPGDAALDQVLLDLPAAYP
ncbi:hypothetical protein AB9K34_14730 [Sedimentitalea sp. XS_ASV28]|uniref:hypothetical protein n=1 Tax=Sedimentitalea sp. XS_ASV28 TaxID=3241296 RepID=UPI0035172891